MINDNLYGVKELYDVVFTADYDVKLGEELVLAGEPIATFSSIQVARFVEKRQKVDAKGGYGNRSRVSWDETRGMQIDFSQGVFSPRHIALFANSELHRVESKDIPELGVAKSDEYGIIELKYTPTNGKVKAISDDGTIRVEANDENQIKGLEPMTHYELFYHRTIKNPSTIILGNRWLTGYLKMTAKAKMKDDKLGTIRTLFMEFPKVQIISEPVFNLGSGQPPMVIHFSVMAHPQGERYTSGVGQFFFLEEGDE